MAPASTTSPLAWFKAVTSPTASNRRAASRPPMPVWASKYADPKVWTLVTATLPLLWIAPPATTTIGPVSACR